MMAERCDYRLDLTLVSPFLFESIVNARVGVDCAQIRDEAGRPIIPAAHIKGVLRDVLETLAERTALITNDEIKKLFGASSTQGAEDTNQPFRGVAIFSDLVAVNEPSKPVSGDYTTRIEIDDQTGAVRTGAIQVIELVAPFGAKVQFSGRLMIRYPEGLDREKCEIALSKALRLIPAIGALKSAGFGAVDPQGCVLECQCAKPLAPPAAKSGERVAYRVTFDRPLLISARYITENLFESDKIVPGAAFKGALADRLMLAGLDPEGNPAWALPLTQLRISHAFPVAEGKQAELPIPASIVYRKTADDIAYADALSGRIGAAPLWNEGVAQFVAGAKKDVRKSWREKTGTPEWRADLLPRTHVAVNEKGAGSGSNRIALEERAYTAAESMLYTTVMLPANSHEWLLIVDAGQVADKGRAGQLLAVLDEGLDGIGKTGAHVCFTRIGERSVPELPHTQTIDIMLKTPAVMFDPVVQQEVSMAKRYAEYFRKELDATLLNLFARQHMAGGYHAMRRKPYAAYYPFVLTEAGSVFRLEITSTDGRQKIESALRFGLPVPDLDAKSVNWRNCPFMPENGYGEIALHDPAGLEMDVLSFVEEAGA